LLSTGSRRRVVSEFSQRRNCRPPIS
jgi:hypothetical protein